MRSKPLTKLSGTLYLLYLKILVLAGARMLYACPKSTILTNNNRSPPLSLHRGTQQGCSLSPILFALALEPLAISIRNSLQITGIVCGTCKCPTSLYADDVILTLADAKESISNLLKLISDFGQFFTFTVNWTSALLRMGTPFH